eukprot:g3447.t1
MDWGPPIDSGGQEISEYQVYMDTLNGEGQSQSNGYQLVGSIIIPDGSSDTPTLRTIRLDSLTKGHTYRLKARARNSITTPTGEEAWSPFSSPIDILTSTGSKPGYIPRFVQVPAPNGTTGGQLGFEWDPPLDAGGREIISYSLFQLQTSSTPATECLATSRLGSNPKCWRMEFKGQFSRDLVNNNGLLVNPVGKALDVNISSTAMPPPGIPTRQYSNFAGFRCNKEYHFLVLATNAVGDGTLSPTSVDRNSGALTTQPLSVKTNACSEPAKMVNPICKSRTSETLTLSWQPPSEADRTFDYGGAPVKFFEVQLSVNRTLKDGIPRDNSVILQDFEDNLESEFKYTGKDFEYVFDRWKNGDDGKLRPGSTYAVRVRMTNTANKVGDWSNIVTCETAPGELGTLKFAASEYSVYEDKAFLDVTVTRVGGTEGQLGVKVLTRPFSRADGSEDATQGVDFGLVNVQLDYQKGEHIKTVRVPINSDDIYEKRLTSSGQLVDEQFQLVLVNLEPPQALSTVDDKMFALVTNDNLYLQADSDLELKFAPFGSGQISNDKSFLVQPATSLDRLAQNGDDIFLRSASKGNYLGAGSEGDTATLWLPGKTQTFKMTFLNTTASPELSSDRKVTLSIDNPDSGTLFLMSSGGVVADPSGCVPSCKGKYKWTEDGSSSDAHWTLKKLQTPELLQNTLTTVTIRDDGDAGTIGFSQDSSSVSVSEADGEISLTLTRTGGNSGAVKVSWDTEIGDNTHAGSQSVHDQWQAEHFREDCSLRPGRSPTDGLIPMQPWPTVDVDAVIAAPCNHEEHPLGNFEPVNDETLVMLDGQDSAVINVHVINNVKYEGGVDGATKSFGVRLRASSIYASPKSQNLTVTGGSMRIWRLSTADDPQVGAATMLSTVNIRDDDGDEMPPSRPGPPIHVARTGGSIQVRPRMPDMVGGDNIEVIAHELYMTTDEKLTYVDAEEKRHVKTVSVDGPDYVDANGNTRKDVRIMDLRIQKDPTLTISSWRLVKIVCMPQFYGKGCTKACPGYERVGNLVYVCSGHGSCASGEEATGSCECDEGYAGVDCSEGDSSVARRTMALTGEASINAAPVIKLDRFDDPIQEANGEEVASRRTSRLDASSKSGDVWMYSNYYFYTVCRTRVQHGVLLDKLNKDPVRNPGLQQQNFLVARSPPSLVLETYTDLPSLPQAPVWQSGATSTGGRIDVKWAKPMDSGGVDPTGYRIVIKLSDAEEGVDNLIADLQGEPWSCDESGICTGIPGMLHDKISGSISYSRGGLVINTGYEVQVQLVNEINAGAKSSSLVIRTQEFPTPPGAIPTPTIVARSGGSITFAFEPPLDRGGVVITGYDVEFGSMKSSCSPNDDNPNIGRLECFQPLSENAMHHLNLASSTNGAQLRVLGLVANKEYWARARADNGIGNTRRPGIWRDSPDRGIFKVKTDTMSMPSAPAAPTVLRATGGMVELGWSNPDDLGGADLSGLDANGNKDNKPDLSGFRIFYRKVSDPISDFQLIYEVPGDVYTKQIGYLESETTYEFRVRAMNPVALCSDEDVDGLPLPGRPEDPEKYVSEGTIVTTLSPTVPGPPTTKQGLFWIKGKDSDGLTTGGKLTLEWTVPFDTGGALLSDLNFELELVNIESANDPVVPSVNGGSDIKPALPRTFLLDDTLTVKGFSV